MSVEAVCRYCLAALSYARCCRGQREDARQCMPMLTPPRCRDIELRFDVTRMLCEGATARLPPFTQRRVAMSPPLSALCHAAAWLLLRMEVAARC